MLSVPAAEFVKRLLDTVAPEEETWRASGRSLYLYLPAGVSQSRLGGVIHERKFGVLPIVRNWRTVLALRDLLAS